MTSDNHQDLRALVMAQQEIIAGLEARLARLEEAPPATAPLPVGPTAEPAVEGAVGDVADLGSVVTDRRRLLSRAATVTAAGVAGGTALALGQATPAAAAAGTFDGNPAVIASANPTSGTGVAAFSGTGTGVDVTVSNGVGVGVTMGSGVGVFATIPSGTAFRGLTTSGNGFDSVATTGSNFVGESGAGAVLKATAGIAASHLELINEQLIPPPPSSLVLRRIGAVVRDGSGDLWLCVKTGTPGLWRRVSGPNTAGSLSLLDAPVRVYDSRPGNAPATGPKTKLANGATRTIDCTLNSTTVPVGAQAVLANVTVVNTSASGYLSAFKAGVAVPLASTVNWAQANSIVANTTIIACSTDAKIACYVPPTSSTDFFLDIIGYFR